MSKNLLYWIGAGIAATVLSIWVTGAYDWLLQKFAPPSPVKIDFQATAGCPAGRLVNLRRHFEDPNMSLEWGADRLVICDADALQTNVVNAPEDIAKAFPGCLKYQGGALRMLRASEAVCEFQAENIYICDGNAGASYPGAVGMGSQSSPVPQCSDATLRKFGFQS